MEFGDVNQIVNETIPALRKLQQQGKARYVGITGYSLRNLLEIASRVAWTASSLIAVITF